MIHKEQIIEEISFRFKVGGSLIQRLGEESISNRNVAVLELIKNSYDAKASKVSVDLVNVNTKEARIVISDNGDGMTYADLENKWLNIASSSKGTKTKESERIPVGEKGIGRLSSESLGKKSTLITKPENERFGYKIIFDWSEYREKNVQLNDISNDGFKFKKLKKDSGTTIEIDDLKHNWNDTFFQKSLLKDIYQLHPPTIKPKGFSISTSFKIDELKKITTSFLANAAYSLKASLTKENSLKYEIKTISGKAKKGKIVLEKRLSCGDASFELFFFYRSTIALKDALNFDLPTSKVKEVSSMLDEYSGIKIYRDGFRIKPYGEEGNDWLSLDAGFQNNSMYPRNNNVIGFISISKITNPKITDTTTREGIILTKEFQDLMSFAKTTIQAVFISFRSDIESHKKKAKKRVAKKRSKKVTPVKSLKTSTGVKHTKLIENIGGSYPQNFYAKLEGEINV